VNGQSLARDLGVVLAEDQVRSAVVRSAQSEVRNSQLPPAEGSVRFLELDALRGLAAVAVMISHFNGLWNRRTMSHAELAFFLGPLQMIAAAHSAVALFFVLSGFVLTLPTLAGRTQPYGVFITRRITRIYLPYLGALALAVACDFMFRRPGGVYLNEWFAGTWSTAVNWRLVWAHVFFIGPYNSQEFNTAFWTLVLEMRVSLIFPVLCYAVLRSSRKIACLLVVLSFVVQGLLPEPATAHTIYAVSSFLVGILLAKYYVPIMSWYQGMERLQRVVLLCVAMLIYTYAQFMKHGPWPLVKFMEPLTTLSVVVVIMASVTASRWRSFLLGAFPQWCGHVSYSLYLIHGTILYSLVELTYGHFPLIYILPVYFVLTFGLARVYFEFVERPSMELGRRLTKRKPKAFEPAATKDLRPA
jgi:peptidoglycan/LPS O-acetylase OafA/YrhL